MSQTPLNIVSPKSLEKQLKVVETRIGALETEIADLQKIKNACLVLLGTGTSAEPMEEIEAAAPTPAPKAKKKKSESDDQDLTSSTSSREDAESEENAAVN